MTPGATSALVPPTHLSRWRRSRRKAFLRLGEQVWALTRRSAGGWIVEPSLGEEVAHRLATSVSWNVEDAIRCVEAHLTIPQWTRVEQGEDVVWSAGPWTVVASPGGARVCRDGVQIIKQIFVSADQGRAWAEARFRRSDRSLFGRDTRKESHSTCLFPVVRATIEEREMMEKVVAHHGLTYSEFVRLAVQFFAIHPEASLRGATAIGNLDMASSPGGTYLT